MNKKQIMILNTVCIYSIYEVVGFLGMMHNMSDALQSSMIKFVKKLDNESSNEETNTDLGSFFSNELNVIVNDVVHQLHNDTDYMFSHYTKSIEKIETNDGFIKAEKQIEYFTLLSSILKPLDQLLTSKDILAYVSLLELNSSHAKKLLKFINCFSPVITQIKNEQKENEEKQQKLKQAPFVAASNNDIDTLKKLYNNGVDIDTTDSNRKTTLALAVMNNQLDAAKYLLSKGADPVLDRLHDTPLSYAITHNFIDIVIEILNSNHDKIDTIQWNGFLSNSCQIDILKDEHCNVLAHILSSNKGKINIHNMAEAAIKNRQYILLKECFNHGADINNESHHKPLIFTAADENNITALKTLLELGANFNLKYHNQSSLLKYAVDNKSKKIINFLIDSKIEITLNDYYSDIFFLINLSELIEKPISEFLKFDLLKIHGYDRNGENFLHAIIKQYNNDNIPFDETKNIISLLINEINFDINHATKDGRNTAMTLFYDNNLLKFLLSFKPDMSQKINNDSNIISEIINKINNSLPIIIKSGVYFNATVNNLPLLDYCFRYKNKYIKLVLNQKIDFNLKDSQGLTVLQKWLVEKELIEPYLIQIAKQGADFSLNIKTGIPIFHVLCALYDGNIIKKIVSLTDIDVHVLDAGDNNATMHAFLAKNTSALLALTELGVNVNQKNKAGGSPLIHAIYESDEAMLDLLENKCGAITDISTHIAWKDIGFIKSHIARYDPKNPEKIPKPNKIMLFLKKLIFIRTVETS